MTEVYLCGCEKLCKIEGARTNALKELIYSKACEKIVGRLIMFTATKGIDCLIRKGKRQNRLVIYFIQTCR